MMKIFYLLVLLPWLAQGAMDHNHAGFTRQLEKFTSAKEGQTYVWYGKWKKEGLSDLNAYLKSLSHVKKSQFAVFTPQEQLAFLINAYNAFTVKLILDHHPVKSIKDTGTLITSPWKKKFFNLLEEESHLDRVEHDLIRGKFAEPRIHFAVNCASIGCPSLMRKAFTATGLEQELTFAEKEFFTNSAKVKFLSGELQVSKILDWYGDDFRKKYGSLEKYLMERAAHYKIMSSPESQKFKVSFLEYDWSLNGE